ncbi:hypothetical protein Raf01_59130 [Rugosimonospora africana]|uniref:Uncharacterized protein n=2 Tax=Rugosimonospora africana TaxID=556532 RepID=A0A8J3VTJ5_9ACTN|nr:hypothetical protein Raf01_59130 [Rugosimonospora africana]
MRYGAVMLSDIWLMVPARGDINNLCATAMRCGQRGDSYVLPYVDSYGPRRLSRRWRPRRPAARSRSGTDGRAAVSAPDRADELVVRFPAPASKPERSAELRVQATVDRDAKTITYELPDKTRTTLDVVTARALQMILWEGVFGSLQPNGPRLLLERTQH